MKALFSMRISWNKVHYCRTEYRFREPLSLWCNLCGPRKLFFSTLSILALSMIASTDQDTGTFFCWNRRTCVLFTFNDNLFIRSQSTTLPISPFIAMIRSFESFPDLNIFESSAKINGNIFRHIAQIINAQQNLTWPYYRILWTTTTNYIFTRMEITIFHKLFSFIEITLERFQG